MHLKMEGIFYFYMCFIGLATEHGEYKQIHCYSHKNMILNIPICRMDTKE
jgi:hypothetical protein